MFRAVAKISICQVNTTIKRRIKQLGTFLVLFFFISYKNNAEFTFIVAGKNSRPQPLMTVLNVIG